MGRHVSVLAVRSRRRTGTMGWLGVPQGPPSSALDAPRKLYNAAIVLHESGAELARHALDRRIVWSQESIRL